MKVLIIGTFVLLQVVAFGQCYYQSQSPYWGQGYRGLFSSEEKSFPQKLSEKVGGKKEIFSRELIPEKNQRLFGWFEGDSNKKYTSRTLQNPSGQWQGNWQRGLLDTQGHKGMFSSRELVSKERYEVPKTEQFQQQGIPRTGEHLQSQGLPKIGEHFKTVLDSRTGQQFQTYDFPQKGEQYQRPVGGNFRYENWGVQDTGFQQYPNKPSYRLAETETKGKPEKIHREEREVKPCARVGEMEHKPEYINRQREIMPEHTCLERKGCYEQGKSKESFESRTVYPGGYPGRGGYSGRIGSMTVNEAENRELQKPYVQVDQVRPIGWEHQVQRSVGYPRKQNLHSWEQMGQKGRIESMTVNEPQGRLENVHEQKWPITGQKFGSQEHLRLVKPESIEKFSQ